MMNMNKSLPLTLVLIFLAASCIIMVKPASGATAVQENAWVEKAPVAAVFIATLVVVCGVFLYFRKRKG